MPRVSVAMSVFNGEIFLAESIQSVLAQTMDDFEFIIIDDGSTDRSAEIIKGFDDPRIRYVHQTNKGLATSLNKAISLSRSDLIARIDSDDLWVPEKLKCQVEFMDKHPEVVLLGGEIQLIDMDGNYMYTVHKPHSDEENRRYLDIKNMWTHSAVIFRQESVEKVGGYITTKYTYFEDYVLWHQLAKLGKVAQLDKVVTKYRVHPYAVSSKTENPRFIEIMKATVKRGYATDDEVSELKEIKMSEANDPKRKEALYHLFLGRSYMFHNYKRRKSIQHLKKSVGLSPNMRIARIYLFMVIFLPKFILKGIYKWKGPMAGFISVEENPA